METLTCHTCGKAFRGRSDKKFCSATCKNQFHNNGPGSQSVAKKVRSALNKNRKILFQLCPEDNALIHRVALEQMGYQWKYFTEIAYTSKGAYYYVFDIGFSPIFKKDQPFALIVHRKHFVDRINLDPWS